MYVIVLVFHIFAYYVHVHLRVGLFSWYCTLAEITSPSMRERVGRISDWPRSSIIAGYKAVCHCPIMYSLYATIKSMITHSWRLIYQPKV